MCIYIHVQRTNSVARGSAELQRDAVVTLKGVTHHSVLHCLPDSKLYPILIFSLSLCLGLQNTFFDNNR